MGRQTLPFVTTYTQSMSHTHRMVPRYHDNVALPYDSAGLRVVFRLRLRFLRLRRIPELRFSQSR